MNAVIAFPASRTRQAGSRDGGAGGEVVIFPGVRRERREFNQTSPAPRARRRRSSRARELEAEES